MEPITSAILAINCAESIAALHLLHSVPNQPSRNPVTELQSRSAGYTLPFEKERSLAGTLAFLAHAKDDPNYIPAVCVEEDSRAACLHILLAVNRCNPDDGETVLQGLKEGFEKLFSHLAYEDGTATRVEHDVFMAIISMCSACILRRLGLVRARRTKQNQSIKEVLRRALEYFKQAQWDDGRSGDFRVANTFMAKAREVIKHVDLWAQHQTPHQLGLLVHAVHRLWLVEGLRMLIETIPNRNMEPASRRHLVNTTSKVARYRESARFLVRLAKKYTSARDMRIVLVNLPPEAFDRVPMDEYRPDLQSAISQINGLKNSAKNIKNICCWLKVTEEGAKDTFAAQSRKTLKKSKIHAEVQLIYHLELSATTTRRARVVCSSKDACWLCNQFILTCEKIHTPRTHGRLYPGWRLPALRGPQSEDMARRYNLRLQNQMGTSLNLLLQRGQKTVYKEPNESTLLTLPWSTSTLPSSAPLDTTMSHRVVQQTTETEREEARESSITSRETHMETLAAAEETALEPRVTPEGGYDNMMPQAKPSTSTTSIPPKDNSELNQGEYISSKVGLAQTSRLYTAGPLELQIEYADSPSENISDKPQKQLSYIVEWLSPQEARILQTLKPECITNVELLEHEISLRTDDGDCLYIAAGAFVLKLVMRPTAQIPGE